MSVDGAVSSLVHHLARLQKSIWFRNGIFIIYESVAVVIKLSASHKWVSEAETLRLSPWLPQNHSDTHIFVRCETVNMLQSFAFFGNSYPTAVVDIKNANCVKRAIIRCYGSGAVVIVHACRAFSTECTEVSVSSNQIQQSANIGLSRLYQSISASLLPNMKFFCLFLQNIMKIVLFLFDF